jgi:hypothetical protein
MGFPTMSMEAACARGFLAGKTVLVTGPTAGLGAAIVHELCMLGPNKPKKVRAAKMFRGGAGLTLWHDIVGGHAEFHTPAR